MHVVLGASLEMILVAVKQIMKQRYAVGTISENLKLALLTLKRFCWKKIVAVLFFRTALYTCTFESSKYKISTL